MTLQPMNASIESAIAEMNAALEKYIAVPTHRTELGVDLMIIMTKLITSVVMAYPVGIRNTLIPPRPNLPELEMPELPEEEFIYLQDFVDSYRITENGRQVRLLSDGCIANLLMADKRLFELCAMREETKLQRWKIKPLRFLHYMVNKAQGHTYIRNRCRKWIKEQEVMKNGKDSKVLPFGEGLQVRCSS